MRGILTPNLNFLTKEWCDYMNLNLFKTYVRVVETKNLSRTAEEFGLSQPAVTKQIQSLEDYYGVLLLERAGRRLKPTEAGETLYQCAREVIKLLERTDSVMETVVESKRGNLNLGASTIPGQYILPDYIKKFADNFPYISISLNISDTEKIYKKIADRELDIGLVGAWLPNRKVEGFKWLPDELLLLVPENHHLAGQAEVKVEDLLHDKWIFREKGSGTRKATEELLSKHGIKKEDLHISIEAGSTEAALASVESEIGISIVSSWAIGKAYPHRRVKSLKLKGPGSTRYFYIIYPRQKSRRKAVENFLQFIKEK